MASLNSRIPQPQESGDRAFPVDMRFRSTELEASLLQQEDWLVMTKLHSLRGQCRNCRRILGNHSFFLRVHEFGVIAQTREADRVVQTRNYGMK